MKTSNAIFLSFLIFLFGGITLLYLGAKYNKDYNDKDNFVFQEKTLPPFSVLVAEAGANISLKSGKVNKIKQGYRKDAVSKFDPYVVRNDTLFISSAQKKQAKENEYFMDSEVFCVNIKSIVSKEKSYINISKFQTDTLNIFMKKSKLDWFGFKKIAFVSIEAKESNIYMKGEKLDKLVVKLDKTELRTPVKKRIENLSGSLKNDSNCTFYMSNSFSLNADATSVFDFYSLIK
nr:hypothetical protein [uncultured Flavobacterium sp.]